MAENENIHVRRIDQVRSLGYDAVIVSGTDPHCSEYVAPRWKQVEWLSGFTGEAGDMVVTQDHAGLWTDSRFFIQAEAQLFGTGVELHPMRVPAQVPIPEWLASRFLEKPVRIAVDGLCQSTAAISGLKEAMEAAYGPEGYEIEDLPDMLGRFWSERPAIPASTVVQPEEKTMGESRSEKLSWLRTAVRKAGCDSIFISALDEIAWLLNVRGNDIDYNPYVISYLLVTPQHAVWFVRQDEDVPVLTGVDNAPYDALEETFDSLKGECGRLMADPSTLNWHVCRQLQGRFDGRQFRLSRSPVPLRKAVKNKREQEGFRRAFIEDGVAMETFLHWLETSVKGGATITEWEAAAQLEAIRSRNVNYCGQSFATISAYGPNAALPHYRTPREGSSVIKPRGLYLCDAGAHFIFGTTDTTRTVPMGRCTRQEKEDYTLVLKGMVDLSLAVFPEGTAGCHIDALARLPLWKASRNYGHGTGHGVGFWLGVHEGPQDLRQNFNPQPLLPGMVLSNEPGLYREGKHGIRHENVVLCREADKSEFGRFYSFETLTCCHIDLSIVRKKLLSDRELDWLRAYNRTVYRMLKSHLAPEVARWLRKKCR